MKKPQRLLIKFLLVLFTLFCTVNVSALETINQSENVFKFQHKLAKNGNAYAQYKLATMYESGIGVDVDVNQARQWYQQSSANGVKAASDRNTYLTIKERGFSKAEHQSWLDGIKADAKKRDVEAMHLLGQLYLNGTGVKKNLKKSLALLTYVNSSGGGNVDSEIAAIQEEINKHKLTADKQRQTVRQNVAVKTPKNNHKKAQKQLYTDSAKKQALAEKRRRYEKVMAQIRMEQRKINEQQAQVTNGQIVAIDDEF